MSYYELSNPQKRIWYTEKICADTSIHNIGGAFRIKGKIVYKVLNEAVNRFVRENEGIRIHLAEIEEQVYQYVSEYEFRQYELIYFTDDNAISTYNEWLENVGKNKFILYDSDLFRFILFKKSDNEGGFCIILHHIIADGWSMSLLVNQISKFYEDILHNRSEKYVSCSYLDYLKIEKQYLNSERCQRDKDFWLKQLKNSNALSIVPEYKDSVGKRCQFDLEVATWKKIKHWLSENKLSMDAFFVSLFLLFDYKKNHKWNKIITLPVFNRIGIKEKKIFGMFTSTMPFQFVFDDSANIINEMHRINKELRQCYIHQRYPYNQLVSELQLSQKGHVNLYCESINLYNTKLNILCDGYETEIDEIYNGHQSYPLQMVLKAWNNVDNISIVFDYKLSEYTEEDIVDIYLGMMDLANIMMEEPEKTVGQIPNLKNEYIQWLHSEFNNTFHFNPDGKTIIELFVDQVKSTPDRIAIRHEQSSLTYEELNQRANQLARKLNQNGIKSEKVVGLLTTHSIETIIGILGILKAGGAYLPLDTAHPESRWIIQLELTVANIVLTNIETSRNMKQQFSIINMNQFQYEEYEDYELGEYSGSNELAYILFTSGSTGEPKGIMVENRQLVNYIVWAKKMYKLSMNDVFPLYSSLAFDLTVTSIFVPLISGCQIVVYHNEEYAHPIMQIIEENIATVIKLTPTHLALFKDYDNRNSRIKKMIVGGEIFKTELAKSIYESFECHVELYNEYGPTETTVGCMIYKYDLHKDLLPAVPIGVPADNTRIYILDSNLNNVAQGVEGEIYIAGDGVTRGYINAEELTRECFIQNPYVYGERMYKSGDLGKVINSGVIQYIGRKDNQVKIRGYRIELDEIEQCLIQYHKVKSAIIKGHVNSQNNQYLIAFVILNEDVDENELYEYLINQLPEYMVPIYYEYLDEFPVTQNGKIDTKRLLTEHSVLSAGFAKESKGKIEHVLLNAVIDVISCKGINASSNFFNIGGDSIKAIQLSNKLRMEGYKLTVKDVLSNPVISDMNKCIQKIVEDKEVSHPTGNMMTSPIVSWFFSQDFKNNGFYHQCVLLKMKISICHEELESVISKLVKIHNALRINYNGNNGGLFYNDSFLDKKVIVERHVIQCDELSQSLPIIKNKLAYLVSDTDISKDFLFRADIFEVCSEKILALTAHHLVVDAVSWQIILNDIGYIIEHKEVKEYQLLQEQSSYQDWVNELYKHGLDAVMKEKEYWIDCVKEKDSEEQEGVINRINNAHVNTTIVLSENSTLSLIEKSKKMFGMSAYEAVCVAILQTIKEFNHQKDVFLELEGNGRTLFNDELDISKTVGWFTSIYPVRYSFGNEDMLMQIKEIKESLRSIPSGGTGYGILRYMKKVKGLEYSRSVRLNYLGNIISYKNQFFDLMDCFALKAETNASTALIDADCWLNKDKLVFNISNNNGYLSVERVNEFTMLLKEKLYDLIYFCSEQKYRQFTSSDFLMIDLSQNELDSLFL